MQIRYGIHTDSSKALSSSAHFSLGYPSGSRYEKFNGYSLGREEYYLAVSASHLLAGEDAAALRQMEGLDFVFLRSGRDNPEPIYALCTALALHFGSQCFVDTRELHRRMVASGIAVGFVPAGEAESYRADGHICLLPIADGRFARDMMICFKRDKHLTDCARSFRDFVISELHLSP